MFAKKNRQKTRQFGKTYDKFPEYQNPKQGSKVPFDTDFYKTLTVPPTISTSERQLPRSVTSTHSSSSSRKPLLPWENEESNGSAPLSQLGRQRPTDVRVPDDIGSGKHNGLDYFSYRTLGGSASAIADTLNGGRRPQPQLKMRAAVSRKIPDKPKVLKAYSSSSSMEFETTTPTTTNTTTTKQTSTKAKPSTKCDLLAGFMDSARNRKGQNGTNTTVRNGSGAHIQSGTRKVEPKSSFSSSSASSSECLDAAGILKQRVVPSASTLTVDPNAEAQKKKLELEALALDEMDTKEALENDRSLQQNAEDDAREEELEIEYDESGTPHFQDHGLDLETESASDRSRHIDEFLGKKPLPFKRKDGASHKEAAPPDMIVLPVYAQLKDYCNMLHLSEESIVCYLRSIGVYDCDWISQDSGERLTKQLRPSTAVALEQWTPEPRPMLATKARHSNAECFDSDDDNDYEFRDPITGEWLPEGSSLRLRREWAPRTPVVCVLGHVDHGKTSLLDYLRDSHVADWESGGITQSIGAFTVELPQTDESGASLQRSFSRMLVFDTPGHAAFSGMRQRGAHVVDAAVLVIAATDGIQPQTRECLAIISREAIPFVIALNKCDRPEAEPWKVKAELRKVYGLSEAKVEMVEMSAKTGEGVDELLETLDLTCALEEPVADYRAPAELVVMESTKSRKDGCAVTCLVRNGTLSNGDYLLEVCGKGQESADASVDSARVARLMDATHCLVQSALPSTAVTFLGGYKDTAQLPAVGTVLMAAQSKAHCEAVLQMRKRQRYFREKISINKRMNGLKLKTKAGAKLRAEGYSEKYPSAMDDAETALEISARWETMDDPRVVNVWIRADTWGAVEAVEGFLSQIRVPQNEYCLKVVSRDTAPVTERCLREADGRNCFILAFNVPLEYAMRGNGKGKRQKAAAGGNYLPKHVQVCSDPVIFHLFSKFSTLLEDKLQPVEEHAIAGRATVQKVFNVRKKDAMSTVAGIVVSNGRILANGHFRVQRDGRTVYEQMGATDLRHFAVSVSMIEGGDECGLQLEFDDWQPSDVIECFEVKLQKNRIESPLFELPPDLEQSLFDMAAGSRKQTDQSLHQFDARTAKLVSDAPRVHLSRKTGATRVG